MSKKNEAVWQVDSACKDATRDIEPTESITPEYVGNAFLLDDGKKFNAYYVLKNLHQYGNTILSANFVKHYGQQRCVSVLKELTGCVVEFSNPETKMPDSEFYILSTDTPQKIRVPPALHDNDFKIYTHLLINKILLLHPKFEQRFNSVMNGTLKQSRHTYSRYSILIKPNVLVLYDKAVNRKIWLNPQTIVNEMYENF